MHKSLGNGIDPSEIIDQYGADILRLWVASSDYHSDIRISNEILKQLSDAYKKIRNTARFILGNISNGNGFNPDADSVSDSELQEIDKWALMRFDALIDKVNKGYDELDFHIAFHSIHNFCVTDMSNFYLDIIKDRLYCESDDSVKRRSAQTVMYRILSGVARLIAPIMSFTAEEIWSYLPHCEADNAESIFLNEMPAKSEVSVSEEFVEKWNLIYLLRQDVNKALEIKRNEKVIGKSLEANVVICCSDDAKTESGNRIIDVISGFAEELAEIFIVSGIKITDGVGEFKESSLEGMSYTIEKASGEKCERCWAYSETVGQNSKHPTLCSRCAGVVE